MTKDVPKRRLLAEAVVVVVSILLAFGIDAWWQGRGERAEERRLLTALLEELRRNAELMATSTDFHEQMLQRTRALLSVAAKGSLDIRADSMDHLLAGLSSWWVPTYERGVVDAVLLSGGLDVIESRKLQGRIAGWQRLLDETTRVELEERRLIHDLWFPLLREEAYMPQIWNVGRTKIAGWQGSEKPVSRQVDHTSLFRNPRFVNVVLEKEMTHEDILVFQARLRASLDTLMAELDDELGRRG